jgi:hypothetical protein
MKTEKELTRDILKITMTIEEVFPELSKYIGEIRISVSGREIDSENLTDYYDSLDSFFKKYALYHGGSHRIT